MSNIFFSIYGIEKNLKYFLWHTWHQSLKNLYLKNIIQYSYRYISSHERLHVYFKKFKKSMLRYVLKGRFSSSYLESISKRLPTVVCCPQKLSPWPKNCSSRWNIWFTIQNNYMDFFKKYDFFLNIWIFAW